MKELDFFDSNCMLGRYKENEGVSFDNKELLYKSMKRYGIAKALVFSSFSKYENPIIGNGMLSEEIGREENLYQCWGVLPNATGEFVDPPVLKQQIINNRVSAVRMFPHLHDFSLSDWCCGELLKTLEEIKIPLLLDYGIQHWSDKYPWEDVHQLCRNYPELPVVLVRLGIAANRNLYPLLKIHDNLFFEISYYAANRGIECVVEKLGPSRMLFGTGAPVYSPACPIGMLYYSAISEQDKIRIAAGNLEMLIGRIEYGKLKEN